MNAVSIFRWWVAVGLALNLILAGPVQSSFFGPLWLWLVVIPLLAYGMTTFTQSYGVLRQQLRRAYWRRVGVQAVRVRR